MTTIRITKTSKKYAEALFETAQKLNIQEKVYETLCTLSEAINSNKDLFNFLDSPIIKTEDKKDVINKLFENNEELIIKNFLYLLSDNSRIELFDEITEDYKNRLNESKEIVSVKAVTAVDMKDYLKEKLKNKLESQLQKKVIIDFETDSEIIGGLVLEVEGTTIDSSVQTKLNNIKKQLV